LVSFDVQAINDADTRIHNNNFFIIFWLNYIYNKDPVF
jgi:hypothetical protein